MDHWIPLIEVLPLGRDDSRAAEIKPILIKLKVNKRDNICHDSFHMLNLYHIKYFCDACRNGGLMPAARLNHVSHSAISQAIRSLESALDTKLLHHGKRRFELTPQGRTFYEHAPSVLREMERVSVLVRSDDRILRGPLRVGMSHSIAAGLMSSHLQRFCSANKLVAPSVFVANSRALSELLESRSIDLGIGVEDGTLVKMERRLVVSGSFVTATARGVSSRRRLQCYVLGDKGSEVEALRSAIRRQAAGDVSFIEVQSWAIIADLTARGLGTGLLPDFIVKSRRDLVRDKMLFELPNYRVCAFFRSFEALSPPAKSFLDAIAARAA